MHVLIEGVWGGRKGGLFSEVEPVWDSVFTAIINMSRQAIACWRPIRQDVGVAVPVGQLEYGREGRGATYSIEEGLRWAERPHWDHTLVYE